MASVTLHQLPEALQRLGVGRSTLYAMITAGDIETVHIGRRVLIPSDSIDRFIEANRQAVSA